MYSTALQLFIAILLVFQLPFADLGGAAPTYYNGSSEPPLFVFGASMVDTGENAAAIPMASITEFPPYGVDYFSKPAGRYSNGRVFMDFISQGLGYGLLDPFLKSVGANFAHGVNFASSGSTARNSTLTGVGNDSSGLFSFMVQIKQFKEFKSQVVAAQSLNRDLLQTLPRRSQIVEGIYFIETAHNDYLTLAFRTPGFDFLALVTSTVSAIENGLRVLYNLGARNIIVMNLIPLGCTPAILTFFDGKANLDKHGCDISWNDLVILHNKHLEDLLDKLRVEVPHANLIIFDAYSLLLDAFHHPSKYGVIYPFQACCGGGGKYNVDLQISCGKSGYINGTYVEAKRCRDPSLYITWDGLHPVESFARYMGKGVLSGKYLKPKFIIKR